MEILVKAHSVTKSYSGHLALDHVSFEIPRGSVFGLLGPNGSGKTSFIRILTGITVPDSGECLYNNKPVLPGYMNHIGYLPEERGLYRKMKVQEQIEYLGRLKGLDKKEARKRTLYWLDRFGLSAWAGRKVEDLSKGMQQKVQFIATVLHNPEFLILDEPFSGFDPINAEMLKNEILQMAASGVTVMLSSHNMNSVEELCDHIALFNKGKLILNGNVKEVKSRYNSGMWEISFRGNWVNFSTALWTGARIAEKSEDKGLLTAVVELLPGNSINQVLGALLNSIELVSVRENLPSMHKIFVREVGGNDLLNRSVLTE